jgi:APA family basic amino acid/polyamine antiporter
VGLAETDGSDLSMGLWTRKSAVDPGSLGGPSFTRHLGLASLTMMGIGATVGAGIFVLTGTAAAHYAGPAISLSFVIASFASLCAGLCYAELASMIPIAGSAYTYAYIALGEGIAWGIGWSLVLEYLFATSTVAIGWAGYFSTALADLGLPLPAVAAGPPFRFDHGAWHATGAWINLPAVAAILGLTVVLSRGIRGSALANGVFVALKLAVILLVICAGARYIHIANWHPFIPPNQGNFGEFGWSGVVRGAGVVFYAYVGFDMVSSSAQEALRPRRDVPLSLLLSLAVCTVLYVAMSLVITGLAPFATLNVPQPVIVAITAAGPRLVWLKPLIDVGIIIGLCSAIMVCLYGQTRLFYAMSRDGLIPPIFSRISPQTHTPVFGTWLVGLAAAAISGLLPIDILGELVSIGTLSAFVIVTIGVLVLRVRHPQWIRPFRVQAVWLVGSMAIMSCLYMMFSLPATTWLRLVIWLAIGAVIYVFYGRKHSVVGCMTAEPEPSHRERFDLEALRGQAIADFGDALALEVTRLTRVALT